MAARHPSHKSAGRGGRVVGLAALMLGGCYYTSPYGYAPYYAPVPATVTQREIPAAPTASGPAPSTVPQAQVDAGPAVPVYVAPAYVPPPYPYYRYHRRFHRRFY